MTNVTVQEALQSAIEALNYVDNRAGIVPPVAYEKIRSTLNQCQAALSEIEKCEPVAEFKTYTGDGGICAPFNRFEFKPDFVNNAKIGTKLYDKPQPSDWVGLNYPEILDCLPEGAKRVPEGWQEFYEAIEAKLKQLNKKG